MNAIVIDVETSSLYGQVIEAAYMPASGLDPNSLWLKKTTSVATQRFKPDLRMDPRAAAVHRILPTSLIDCEPSRDALSFFPSSAEFWVGHNILYDWGRLGRPKDKKLVCTFRLAQLLWPKLSSFKLDVLFLELYGINEITLNRLKEQHGAANDVLVCGAVLCRILKDAGVNEVSELPYMTHPDHWRCNAST